MTLTELANKYNTDKGTNPSSTRHGYTPLYERYTDHFRNDPIKLLEIGVVMEGTEGGTFIKNVV